MLGFGGSTRTNKNGQVSIQEEALGEFRVRIKKLWYPPTLSTSWLDLEWACGIEQLKKSGKKTNTTSQQVLGRMDDAFGKSAKTKMTALAKSIDVNGGWTDFNGKIFSNPRIGQTIRFYHSPLMDNLQYV